MLAVDKVKKDQRFNQNLRPKRILVLDDDPVLRTVAETLLSELGYNVLLMEDGLHNDSFFAKLKVDAAIVDLGLPGISGLEVIEKLRASERGRNMPVFVVTGSTNMAEIRSCYEERGVAFVLSKPVDWGLLTAQLRDAFAAAEAAA